MSKSYPTASSSQNSPLKTRYSLTTARWPIPQKHWSRPKTPIKTQRRAQPSQVWQAPRYTMKQKIPAVYFQDSPSRRRLSRRRCWMIKSSSYRSWIRSKVSRNQNNSLNRTSLWSVIGVARKSQRYFSRESWVRCRKSRIASVVSSVIFCCLWSAGEIKWGVRWHVKRLKKVSRYQRTPGEIS